MYDLAVAGVNDHRPCRRRVPGSRVRPILQGLGMTMDDQKTTPQTDFRSDNTGRVAPELLEALIRANTGTAFGYGADEWTALLQRRFSELFETEVAVYPVATGTAANALSLAALSPSFGAVYCAPEAHVNTAEANATGFFSGG